MRDMVQMNAEIPRNLKRRAFVAFAERDVRFAPWLRAQLETWLEETEQSNAGIARPENDSEENGESAIRPQCLAAGG